MKIECGSIVFGFGKHQKEEEKKKSWRRHIKQFSRIEIECILPSATNCIHNIGNIVPIPFTTFVYVSEWDSNKIACSMRHCFTYLLASQLIIVSINFCSLFYVIIFFISFKVAKSKMFSLRWAEPFFFLSSCDVIDFSSTATKDATCYLHFMYFFLLWQLLFYFFFFLFRSVFFIIFSHHINIIT